MRQKKMPLSLKLAHDNFEAEALKSDIPVLVQFWSSWCPPCKMMDPIIEELSGELDGKVKIAKINVDQNPKIREQFGVGGVPTIIVFKDGAAVKREIGSRSKK